ncbi:hypothetical protein [Acinetobacter baumannii]|uniref:hypothetical protein n=1 Tax=Acinetobacter baumannii TaxID=470 RepID=UPI00066CA0F2|nr:hypothetical protein [Acinetobacter baumannii]
MKPEQFIREQGLPEAKRILERAPEGATHYRDLSCGTRYTKNVSETECYVWTNTHWRRSVVPYQIFTSEVIKSLSDLKRLVESLERINKCGGLYGFKTYCNGDYSQEDLQAIRDHESIYGGGDETN